MKEEKKITFFITNIFLYLDIDSTRYLFKCCLYECVSNNNNLKQVEVEFADIIHKFEWSWNIFKMWGNT